MKLYLEEIRNLPDINDDILKNYYLAVKSSYQELVNEIKNNKIVPLNIAYKKDDLEEINQLSDNIKANFKEVLILGVGGSSLGARTLCSIKNKTDLKLRFLESIDAVSVKRQLEKINLKETFFLVISKSGQTIETICQTLIIIDFLKKFQITDFNQRFLFVTENKESDIAKIAKDINADIVDHPKDIGGRYSYLTIVALLPSALAGFNVGNIRDGAKNILDDFIEKDNFAENNIVKSCIYQLYLFDKGYNANVIMPYIDVLRDFNNWYRQLWAESLGKDGFGSIPINSMGTVDQHSQLQLYLDGPKDKFFNFIVNQNPVENFNINDLENVKTIFGGKTLNNIVAAEQNSTIDILSQHNAPIRIFKLLELNEKSISALMMQMFLETILIAKLKKINPFDQPAVEKRKILSKEYLKNND